MTLKKTIHIVQTRDWTIIDCDNEREYQDTIKEYCMNVKRSLCLSLNMREQEKYDKMNEREQWTYKNYLLNNNKS